MVAFPLDLGLYIEDLHCEHETAAYSMHRSGGDGTAKVLTYLLTDAESNSITL